MTFDTRSTTSSFLLAYTIPATEGFIIRMPIRLPETSIAVGLDIMFGTVCWVKVSIARINVRYCLLWERWPHANDVLAQDLRIGFVNIAVIVHIGGRPLCRSGSKKTTCNLETQASVNQVDGTITIDVTIGDGNGARQLG